MVGFCFGCIAFNEFNFASIIVIGCVLCGNVLIVCIICIGNVLCFVIVCFYFIN